MNADKTPRLAERLRAHSRNETRPQDYPQLLADCAQGSDELTRLREALEKIASYTPTSTFDPIEIAGEALEDDP